MSTIPRLAGPPVLGRNLTLLRDPLGMFTHARRTRGDVVEIDLGVAGPVYAVFHPDGVKQVLSHGRRTHRQLLRELLGKGLFTTPSGADWRRRRRLVQPLFHAVRLTDTLPLLRDALDTALRTRWRPGGTVDLAAEMKHANVAMMVDATFGARDDVDRAGARRTLDFLLGYVDRRLFTAVKPPVSWPTPANRRYHRDIAELRRIIRDAMVVLRRDPGTPPSFLDGLLASQADPLTPEFTDEELVDEVLSVFIAGTETTGTALTWALHLLSTHPGVAASLHAEVATASADATAPDRLPALELPGAIMREALRLYPPAWALRRVLDDPLDVGGATLPAGARVFVSSYVTHRHEAFWTDPDRFDPERWLHERAAKQHRFAYFPFGAGAHQCAGNAFAQLQGELVLTRVAQLFRLDPADTDAPRARPTIALAPVPGPTALLTPA